MKIFITGINGFVGSCMANYFIAKGFEVYGIGRQNEKAKNLHPNCGYIIGDIKNKLPSIDADIVIHAAALATDKATYTDFYNNNVIGTKNVLDACNYVKVFIQISTSSVYAFKNKPMQEIEAGIDIEKLSDYGKTKFIAEQLVIKNNTIAQKFILRPRAIYGIHDRIILPRLLKLVKGNYLILPKHITPKTSLTHINNLVLAVNLCLQSNTTQSNTAIYNIADSQTYHLGRIIEKLLKAVTFKNLWLIKIPKFIWNSLIVFNKYLNFNKALTKFGSNEITKIAVLNIEAAKKEINYSPEHNMHQSINAIASWVDEIGGWKKYSTNKY